jgi:hypothetical protein
MSSRYAVQVDELVATAQVPVAEQGTLVDEPPFDWVPEARFPVLPMGPDGSGPDGD